MQTLSVKERLLQVEIDLPRLAQLAEAERAFRAASPEADNPWHGATEKYADLKAERDDLVLQAKGQRLNELLTKTRDLESKLEVLSAKRIQADRALAEIAAHPTIQRYKAATYECMRQGWGRSWEMFRSFFQSNRTPRQGCVESDYFFLNSEQARAVGVMFDLERDRPIIHEWNRAESAANLALVQWNDCNEALRHLRRENPELQAMG